MPPKGIIHETSMSFAECQISPIDVHFHLQRSLEIFDKNSADKVLFKNHKEIKLSPLIPIWVSTTLAQDSDLTPFCFGDLSQGEKLSEIKPLLAKLQIIFREFHSLVARKGNSFM